MTIWGRLAAEVIEWEGRVSELGDHVSGLQRTAREQQSIIDSLIWDHQFNPQSVGVSDIVHAREVLDKVQSALVECRDALLVSEEKLASVRLLATPPMPRIPWWRPIQESLAEFFWPLIIVRAVRSN